MIEHKIEQNSQVFKPKERSKNAENSIAYWGNERALIVQEFFLASNNFNPCLFGVFEERLEGFWTNFRKLLGCMFFVFKTTKKGVTWPRENVWSFKKGSLSESKKMEESSVDEIKRKNLPFSSSQNCHRWTNQRKLRGSVGKGRGKGLLLSGCACLVFSFLFVLKETPREKRKTKIILSKNCKVWNKIKRFWSGMKPFDYFNVGLFPPFFLCFLILFNILGDHENANLNRGGLIENFEFISKKKKKLDSVAIEDFWKLWSMIIVLSIEKEQFSESRQFNCLLPSIFCVSFSCSFSPLPFPFCSSSIVFLFRFLPLLLFWKVAKKRTENEVVKKKNDFKLISKSDGKTCQKNNRNVLEFVFSLRNLRKYYRNSKDEKKEG